MWQERSLCVTAKLDGKIFFPQGETGRKPKGVESRSMDTKQREIANKYCSRCPTQVECLEYALEMGIFYQDGVYGGKTEEERRVILRRRERKQAVA